MITKKSMKILGAVVFGLTTRTALGAWLGGDFDLSWYSIDGGGAARSTGGEFEMSGTVGQPDAGEMSGGGFTLTGGFWGGVSSAMTRPGWVLSHQKISDTEGGFTGILDDRDDFGGALASLGDLDGDGVGDLAVAAAFDDDGGDDRGAVWVLFLNPDGTVKSHQKISDTEGGFTGTLEELDIFGISLTSLGDLDGDGVGDLAVGANGDDDGGNPPDANRGAVWVLFLNPDGTVKSHQKISDTQGGFTGTLNDGDGFGFSAASLGDLDGDGVGELAVGAGGDAEGGFDRGAVWVLFLNPDGTVLSYQKINDIHGGFTGTLDDSDYFGRSLVSMGDLDGDGDGDLAVGAWGDDDGGTDRGAVWVLFLDGVVGCIRDPEWICDGDTDGDGQVNPVDSGLIQAAFGSIEEGDLCQYDMDCDGQINPVDSGIVQSLFGTCEEPRTACP